jgi:hypothetical protein
MKIITFFLLFLLMSCNNGAQKISAEENKNTIDWKILRIESGNQTIIIDRNEDYGVRDTCNFEEIKINESLTEYRPINRGQEYFDISPQDKDSLFNYIYDIVTNPVYTDQFATCYVGNVSIGFSVGNTTLACKYSSIGNWTTISGSTKRLYNLLRMKTKISEY